MEQTSKNIKSFVRIHFTVLELSGLGMAGAEQREEKPEEEGSGFSCN